MPRKGLVGAFFGLWWTTGAVLLYLSVRAVLPAVGGRLHDSHAALLGALEAVAAALFLIPRTMRIGAVVLLVTVAIAFITHLDQRRFRGDLLVYAAAVSFALVHGPVPLSSLRPRR